MTVHVYERILQLLEAEGINTLFGIPDPSFFHMFTTAEERGWQVIAPHHEEAGAFMADGVWRMTGNPGVVVGNQGPGVANLMPAAICAAKENAPIIFIGGQRKRVADQKIRRGRIQYIRQPPHFESAMKYVGVIEYAEQTDEIFHEAFRRALSGTPGPVYIEYPMHVVMEKLDLPPPAAPESYRLVHQGASAESIDTAVEMIQSASSPILLVGHGAFSSRALDKVGKLALAMECPIIQTSGGCSFVQGMEDRTFAYGFSPAGVEAVRKSDVVIAIGTELGEPVHHGTGQHWADNDAERKWIYIERDPLTIGVNRPVDVPLVGDLRDVVPQLTSALEGKPRKRSDDFEKWIKMHAEHREEMAASVPSASAPVHPGRLVYETTRALPEDAVFVRDGGSLVIFSWAYLQATPRDFLWNQNFGHLGTGIPYAIGAQLSVGDERRVVLLSGDSAFLFHISELETAVRRNLPIVCVVGCDYAWGLEVRGYRAMFGQDTRETGSHWGHIRLDKIAEGFGAYGEYVERAEDIGPAIERALATGKTAVIQVPIDGKENAGQPPNYDEFKTWYTDFSY